MQSEARKGLLVPSGHLTVKDYSELWLQRESEKTSAGRGLAPSTLGFYRQIFDLYVNPTLGSRPLPALLVEDVERMMTTLSRLGKSPRTVQAARNALGRLLGSARRDGLVAEVVTTHASQVRRTLADDAGPTSKALQPEEVRKLFEVAAATQWEPLLATLALLGLRRGEALGLSWADVDLDAGVLTVRRSLSRVATDGKTRLVISPTKTKGSRRPLPIPPILVDLLRTWRIEQTRQRLQIGENWGLTWVDECLVFTTPLGTPIDPDNLRHALERLGREAGIGHVHPHQLRHSVASVLIASGHTPPEVARVLGHSSPAVTLTYYARAFDRAVIRAVETVAGAIANGT
jgi:integrase